MKPGNFQMYTNLDGSQYLLGSAATVNDLVRRVQDQLVLADVARFVFVTDVEITQRIKSHNGFIAEFIAHKQMSLVRKDFLEWSGGYEPSSESQIGLYCGTACGVDLEESVVECIMIKWLEAVNNG